ncbi:MAG: restriction endonuclease subunit S [bacterium]|nr:restriction endonuclease subunit S [bacterium]
MSEIDFESCKKISNTDYETLSKKIKPSLGDIIFARYATIGTVCYVDVERDCVISYSCVTIKPTKGKLDGKYLYFFLQSSTFFEDIGQYINSNTQGNVGIESLHKVKIITPPLAEQQEIADYLDKKTAEIDALVAKKEALAKDV